MSQQRTVRKPATLEGIGLHSGEQVRVTVSPAAPDTGVIFRAADGTLIPANAEHVVDSRSATTIGAFGVRVRTIEHLMAAAGGLGVDNLIVDVEGSEIPAADGSARPFVELLLAAGLATLPVPRRPLVVAERIRVGDEQRWLEIAPGEDLRIDYTLDVKHPVIGLQVASFAITEPTFVDEVAPARTYGFLKDVPVMRQNGLALGGSLENAVVVGKRIVLNDHLRFGDEFVRHKILDLVGDLHLLGRPVVGTLSGKNAGHALNHQLVTALLKAEAGERRRSARPAAVQPLAAAADAAMAAVPAGRRLSGAGRR
jgi:UDP-3-O-acyl N-acetylglucosamine deacetylase